MSNADLPRSPQRDDAPAGVYDLEAIHRHEAILSELLARASALKADAWNFLGDERIDGTLRGIVGRLAGRKNDLTKGIAQAASVATHCPHCQQPTSPGSMHTCNPMFASEATETPPAPSWAHVCMTPDENGEQQQCEACDHDHQAGYPSNQHAPSLSSGTPAGSETVERISAAIEWAHREGESTAMMVREHGITTLDLREVLASLRSAQERVTELTTENAGLAASWEFELLRADRTADALAFSQAREGELMGYAKHRADCRVGSRAGCDPQAAWGAPCSCGLSALLSRVVRSVDGGTPA